MVVVSGDTTNPNIKNSEQAERIDDDSYKCYQNTSFLD